MWMILFCIFNYQHFDSILSDIYPEDLLASRSGDNNKCVSYLDTKLIIKGDLLEVEVYHKVNEFNFPVVLYTFPEGNMPIIKVGHNIFAAQLIRFARISCLPAFISRAEMLYNIFSERGYKTDLLIKSCTKIFDQQEHNLIHKFGLFSSLQIPFHMGMIA